jgi:diguanylate cyclase (GGDEF)-like protein/PAS domain S-box-containing protein
MVFSRSPKWLSVVTGLFVAIVCVSVAGLSYWREVGSRAADLRNAEVETANLARSLTQYADDTFELADNFLVAIVERLETDGQSSPAILRLQKSLQSRGPALGRIRGLFVYDSDGKWLATSEQGDFSNFNNSDRNYFALHKNSPGRGLHLSSPVKSRSSDRWIIPVSRRFDDADGSFAGVVLATVEVSHFAQFFRKFEIGPYGSISLLSEAGIMLARHPEDEAFIGRDLSGGQLIKKIQTGSRDGVYYFDSPLDGRERLSSFRVSSRYPLVVLATKAKEDVLAGWRNEAIDRSAFVVSLTLAIALVGFLLVRQLLQRQRMSAALRAKEADFRLLAEESSDMVMRIGIDGRIRYVSPSSARLLGWDSKSLHGRPALEGVKAEDLPGVQTIISDLARGVVQEAKIVYRTRHRDKRELWLETALRATRDQETGLIDGVVAISRDMTEHKDLEKKLEALATTDSLTGLANRRHFDERLREEWSRAKREGVPLSVLMIDVDNFKRFNDYYGHQAGDDALRALARILLSGALRPADLPARFGGEEFVMLLPNTDLDGSEQVAGRVRSELHNLSLPHLQNLPSGIMTVSIGAASAWPGSLDVDPSILVEAADGAMYAAKRTGRDRCVAAGRAPEWSGTVVASTPSVN